MSHYSGSSVVTIETDLSPEDLERRVQEKLESVSQDVFLYWTDEDTHLDDSALDTLLLQYDSWCDAESAQEIYEYFEENFEFSGSDLIISVYSEVSSPEIFDYLVKTFSYLSNTPFSECVVTGNCSVLGYSQEKVYINRDGEEVEEEEYWKSKLLVTA